MLRANLHCPKALARSQRGFTLIEILVSLLVFAFGVLALVGLQSTAVRFSTDAQQRADATFLADQLLGRLLISSPADPDVYQHQPGDGVNAQGRPNCAPSGDASADPLITGWLAEVTEVLGATADPDFQQVVVVEVDPTPGAEVWDVTVRLCWRNREGSPPMTLEVMNRVQFQ